MQRTHVTVCSACVTIKEGFHPSIFYSILFEQTNVVVCKSFLENFCDILSKLE